MHSHDPKERVVITGLGVISSIGTGKDEFWPNLLLGRSGIKKVELIDVSHFRTPLGGEIKDFEPELYMTQESVRNCGRTSQLGIAATKLALDDAGLAGTDWGGESVSVIMGTTNGESRVIEAISDAWVQGGEGAVASADILRYPGNVISLNIAREVGVDANCIVIPNACAAGNYSIGYGYDLIKTGRSSVVIAGGCDALSRIAFAGFDRLFAIAPERCQPFDKNRKGIMVGEGAGVLVMETLERARARGAHAYAEILGYALSCDASHMTIPSSDGVVTVMEKALRNASVSKEDIDYISAHGTGTPMNDKVESGAINRVFGERTAKIPVSSIKSMLGHTMGAASALEAITCVMAIHDSKIPPTINFETPDEECRIDCVPNRMRSADVKIAMNNSFAFGGNNACVLFGGLN